MKFNLKIILIITILLVSISFVSATPLDSLNKFYQASVDGDIDAYIAIQDPLFLEQQEMDATAYFQSSFDEVNTLDYEIINPEVFEEENSTLIFYELKGDAEIDGEQISIDNDMVAFLWKYDDWKVRWSITRTLYEEKIALGFIMDVAIESTIDEAQGISLKQELINEGFDLTLPDEENLSLTSSTNSNKIPWVWIIIIILILLIVIFRKKIFVKVIKHKSSKKLKDTYKKAKKYSKEGFEKEKHNIKNTIQDIKKYSKEGYDVAKPHIKKGIENVKVHSKDIYDNTKPLVNKLGKKTKEVAKETAKQAKDLAKKAQDLANKKK